MWGSLPTRRLVQTSDWTVDLRTLEGQQGSGVDPIRSAAGVNSPKSKRVKFLRYLSRSYQEVDNRNQPKLHASAT